jgi:hypothetical protein
LANYIEEYCARIRRGGARGLAEKPVVIGQDNIYAMHYVPYEHWNNSARLVIVSTTPGHTHVRLAATVTEELLQTKRQDHGSSARTSAAWSWAGGWCALTSYECSTTFACRH